MKELICRMRGYAFGYSHEMRLGVPVQDGASPDGY